MIFLHILRTGTIRPIKLLGENLSPPGKNYYSQKIIFWKNPPIAYQSNNKLQVVFFKNQFLWKLYMKKLYFLYFRFGIYEKELGGRLLLKNLNLKKPWLVIEYWKVVLIFYIFGKYKHMELQNCYEKKFYLLGKNIIAKFHFFKWSKL